MEDVELLTLIQIRRIKPFPIILVGSEFWNDLIETLKDRLLENGAIAEKDLELFEIIDDPHEVAEHVKKTVIL